MELGKTSTTRFCGASKHNIDQHLLAQLVARRAQWRHSARARHGSLASPTTRRTEDISEWATIFAARHAGFHVGNITAGQFVYLGGQQRLMVSSPEQPQLDVTASTRLLQPERCSQRDNQLATREQRPGEPLSDPAGRWITDSAIRYRDCQPRRNIQSRESHHQHDEWLLIGGGVSLCSGKFFMPSL